MVGLYRLMRSQPSFYNGCTDTVICESIKIVEPNTAYCFISAVSKIGGYISDFLVDIYFGGLMKRKTKFAFFLIHGG